MARGKYSGVIDKLPKTHNTEPTYQERVEKVKAFLTSEPDFKLHGSVLAREYVGLRQEKDKLEDELGDVNLRLEAVSQLMVDQLEAEGTTSLKLDSGHSVSVRIEPYAQVTDKEANRLWCVQQGLERQMTLPWATLNSLAKQMLLNGEKEPDGVKIYQKTKIVLGSAGAHEDA